MSDHSVQTNGGGHDGQVAFLKQYRWTKILTNISSMFLPFNQKHQSQLLDICHVHHAKRKEFISLMCLVTGVNSQRKTIKRSLILPKMTPAYHGLICLIG